MLRLNSVITEGFGKTTGLISFLYSYLLNAYGLNFHDLIIVNHIGSDLQEKIFYDKDRFHINIRYPLDNTFSHQSPVKKNSIFLDIIHNALLRLSNEDIRIAPGKLEEIRQEIINSNFHLEFVYMAVPNGIDKALVAKIILRPYVDKFDFFVRIDYEGQTKWEALIYEGGPDSYYFDDIFYNGKWKGEKEFIITGKRSEIEFHIDPDIRNIILINTSENKHKAPIFNLFRVNAGSQELQDYINSLPPAVAAIITYHPG